jgi:hypothetical protein
MTTFQPITDLTSFRAIMLRIEYQCDAAQALGLLQQDQIKL